MSAVLETIPASVARQALDLLARNKVGEAQLLLQLAIDPEIDAIEAKADRIELDAISFRRALARCPTPVHPISQRDEE